MEPKSAPVLSQTNVTPIPPTQTQPLAVPVIQSQDFTCKNCHMKILGDYYYCPNCGKKIKEPPFKFSALKTTGIMLESVLLPPLGLFPGIKYLRYKDPVAKAIGITAIVITIIATILMCIFLKNYIDTVNKQLNDVNYLNNIYNNPSGSVQNQVQQLQNTH